MDLTTRVELLLEQQGIRPASGTHGHADGYVLKTKRNGAVRLRAGLGLTTVGAGGVRLYRSNAELGTCAEILTRAGLRIERKRDRQGDHLVIADSARS